MHPSARALPRAFALALALAPTMSAAAPQVRVEFTDPRVNEAAVEAELDSLATGDLRLSEAQTFPSQMAEATAFSTKGMGVDYASSPQRFVFGGSVGSAAYGSGFGFSRGDDLLPTGGFAFALSGMAGINLGAAAPEDSAARRFVLYANGMTGSTSREPFGADFTNLGAHLQVVLARGVSAGPASWGGLALTAGYEYTRYALELRDDLELKSKIATWKPTGVYRVETFDNTVPIELSTNMKVSVIGFFGGAALDIRPTARVESSVLLDGPVRAPINGSRPEVGSARVTDSFTLQGSGLAPRVFFGPQVHLGPLKVVGHVNVGAGGKMGGHAGLRVAL